MTSETASAEGVALEYTELTLDTVGQVLKGELELLPAVENPEQASKRILTRIFEAETLDDVLAPQKDVVQGKTFIGVPFELRSVDWLQSEHEEGPGIFTVCDALVLQDSIEAAEGDLIRLSLGGAQVLGQLYRIVTEQGLPRRIVQRTTEKATRRGRYPRWLEDWKEGDK